MVQRSLIWLSLCIYPAAGLNFHEAGLKNELKWLRLRTQSLRLRQKEREREEINEREREHVFVTRRKWIDDLL